MDITQTPSAPAPSAPLAPVAPPAPPVAPNTLAEFRAQKAASLSGLAEPPVEAPAAPVEPVALEEPPEPIEGDEPTVEVKPPEQAPNHRWKDPDTGVTLDLRRRDHRRIRRLLEERSDLAQRVQQPAYQPPQTQEPPQARQPQPQAFQPDPNDPEPLLEQFAEQADPYGAHNAALARWHARQEFHQLQAEHSRVERERRTSAAITSAQQAFDAELPQVRTRYADFDAAHTEVLETLGRIPSPVRAPIVHRLLTSPVKHDLTHYLGSHPDDLAAVVQARSAYEQGLALGAIETRVRALVNQRARGAAPLSTPAPPVPAPMAPVGGGASPGTVPDAKTMNLAQFRANKSKFGIRA